MFNNPFDSFHNTVAEAKEEREQLDRLLTISTPRERLLVVGIALLLCIVAAWLFFGSVARNVTLDGVLAEPVLVLFEGKETVRALVWIDSDVAPRIEAGMPAAIDLTMTDGKADALGGVIETITPVSETLAAFQSAAPVSVYLVEILLDEGVDLPSLARMECRVFVELDRQSPVALFGMRRP